MEIKIFGKSLFKMQGKRQIYLENATNQLRTSKYLPDFYGADEFGPLFSNYVELTTVGKIKSKGSKKGKKEKTEIKIEITPKGVYELKMLHDEKFKLNTDKEYVENQISDFKEKFSLLKAEEYDMRHGVDEISSILVRLENRKKYSEVKDFFEEYPYTTTTKINQVVKAHDNLKLGQIAQFVADMPKEAITVMKDYNKNTAKVCGKRAVFYIIADKKDFKKTDGRRDPILLAQSPFGHFWQILGVWDKEMMFLEEL